ncbi:hypothetical protein DB88DRAFT_267838 [Papiliotrema laurentii]|uniref:Uncharacterized protein n=1 Tax=Papiliotrema laurentii TaxID=5418 RepID=A0AAD9D2T5_PAPLA|nr:hypothetical protein DB88DRAFT_267838 [Papiliotrema laurentii]
MAFSDETKDRFNAAIGVAKTAVTIGWIPFVLWVGWRNSSPQPTLIKQVLIHPHPTLSLLPIGIRADPSAGSSLPWLRMGRLEDRVVNRQSTVSKPLNAVNSTRYSGVLYRFTDLLTTVWRGFTLCHR